MDMTFTTIKQIMRYLMEYLKMKIKELLLY